MRSEAIQLADAQPDLLELVETLDFPERSEWEELGVIYGLTPAPRLLLETAQALHRAYAEVQPLEKLLAKHRLLALSRAGLRERLKVLRQIAASDPTNPIWFADIRILETAWYRLFPQQVTGALERSDTAGAIALVKGLEQEQWLERPLEATTGDVQFRVFPTLESRLLQAWQTRDAATAKLLMECGNHVARLAGLSWPPHKNSLVPVLAWLNDREQAQAEFRKAQTKLQNLEQCLEDGASIRELETLYQNLLHSQLAIPSSTEKRYQMRIASLRTGLKERRRERLILTIVALLGILVLVTLFGFILARR